MSGGSREDPAHKRADRDDFARDRARLVHSASLRRLSAKTQVVQPSDDDFVRNRLTHSLEVAQIGREFGAALGCSADVVDTACLAHDLGHPPFGHNGEQALDDDRGQGIGGFEGNAQTLRLLTRLEAKRVAPRRTARRAQPDAGQPRRVDQVPVGAAARGQSPRASSASTPTTARSSTGSATASPPGRRCLEAEVMDWSDDVAYSVHDVEDAVASGRLDLRRLRDTSDVEQVLAMAGGLYAADLGADDLGAALERVLATGAVPTAYDGSRRDLAALKDMTSRLIGRFVLAVEVATRERHGAGDLTRYAADLVVPDVTRAECAVLKAVAAHFVMYAEERVEVMAGQRAVVKDLVTAYRDAPEERLDPDLLVDWKAADSDAAALRVVIDQVASLTDVRALTLHRRWC